MINFFRKIRKQLASENKFQKYSRYAFGEILLVIVGILIALQINNWNEARKQNTSFNVILEQLYNDLDIQSQKLATTKQLIQGEIGLIDTLLNNPDPIETYKLPYVLTYVDFTYDMAAIKIQNPFELISQLDAYANNPIQMKLVKKIRASLNNTYWNVKTKGEIIEKIFNDSNIPIPVTDRSSSLYNDFRNVDLTFFTPAEIVKVKDMVKLPEIRSVLRTLKKNKEFFLMIAVNNSIGDTNSILTLIEHYNPEISLLYNNVGIIGTAINGYDDVDSTPMNLTDTKNCIWEIDIHLNEGTVKFRAENSWNENWGASLVNSTFPKGQTTFFGGDIPVKEGQYHIVLNLKEKTYEFINQDD